MLVGRAQSGSNLLALQGRTEDENILWVHANEGMEIDNVVLAEHGITDDDAGLLEKTGRGNGGFDILKSSDHGLQCRERPVLDQARILAGLPRQY
jgi:hypothetical protein